MGYYSLMFVNGGFKDIFVELLRCFYLALKYLKAVLKRAQQKPSPWLCPKRVEVGGSRRQGTGLCTRKEKMLSIQHFLSQFGTQTRRPSVSPEKGSEILRDLRTTSLRIATLLQS